MIVVTGAAGFIGSCLVDRLMAMGHDHNIVLVDDFSKKNKEANLINKSHLLKIERDQFISWLGFNGFDVEMVFHMGARTDTTEQDVALFDKLNLNYSKSLFQLCCDFAIPFVYASSAATYGIGEFGFDDDESKIPLLQPLNPYGWSKQNFDIWVLAQAKKPPFWAGLKFFNVYGPNEYHKGRMASVIFHTFNKIKENGSMQLFKSHRPDFADGQQSRDFIYVKDVVNIISHFIHFEQIKPGIFNVGTGKVFGDDAWEIQIKDLPYLQVGPYHTNTVAGLELAMDILKRRKNPNKQIMMITDGKPTCIKKGKKYFKNSFGLDRTIVNRTLALALKAKKLHIPVTTFMIARDPYLVNFVDQFTLANGGKAFYSSLQGLGEFIFMDYKTNKRKSRN